MAHLLGSRNCLDSLSKDVSSMQETINSIVKKTGRFQFASWKFPSKIAIDLDVAELLEDYSYCNDEDSNKLSHIILFELVIDRFCLILQAASQLFDMVFITKDEQNASRPQSRTVTSTMSVGLISKIFWNKVSQIQYSYENLEKQLSEYNQSLMDMENVFLEMKIENDSFKRKTKNEKEKENGKKEKIEETVNIEEESNNCIPVPSKSSSTQTFETAFVPCEACCSMQSNLLTVGTEVINICETQGLPSSLSKQHKLMRDTQMTASDVTRWAHEQERDLKKINNYLDSLHKQINPSKEQLKSSNSSCSKLQDDFNKMSIERDKMEALYNDSQKECCSFKESYERTKKELDRQESKLSELQKSNIKLEFENSNLKKSLEGATGNILKYEKNIAALEQGMTSLTTQLESELKEKQKLTDAFSDISTLQAQKKETEQKLTDVSVERDKLRAENKVVLKHDQGLQTKQTTLLSRLEQLDETCEDLRDDLLTAQKEKNDMLQTNKILQEEKNNLLLDVENVKRINKEHVRKSRDRENGFHSITTNPSHDKELTELTNQLKLLVSYPVIGPKYKTAEEEYTTLTQRIPPLKDGNEDVVKDMERQLQTNNIRISILEEQNNSLRNTLLKLEGENSTKENFPEKVSSYRNSVDDDISSFGRYNDRHHSAPVRILQDQSVTPKPPSEPRSSSKPTRTWSGGKNIKKEAFDIGARLANLDRLKDKTKITKFDWTTSTDSKGAWTEKNTHLETTSVSCPDCDKTYLSKRDLDIHKTFCYGRV